MKFFRGSILEKFSSCCQLLERRKISHDFMDFMVHYRANSGGITIWETQKCDEICKFRTLVSGGKFKCLGSKHQWIVRQ